MFTVFSSLLLYRRRFYVFMILIHVFHNLFLSIPLSPECHWNVKLNNNIISHKFEQQLDITEMYSDWPKTQSNNIKHACNFETGCIYLHQLNSLIGEYISDSNGNYGLKELSSFIMASSVWHPGRLWVRQGVLKSWNITSLASGLSNFLWSDSQHRQDRNEGWGWSQTNRDLH